MVMRSCWVVLIAASCAAGLRADTLEILPKQISLTTSQSRQTVIAQRMDGGKYLGQAADAKFTSSDDKIVRIEDGVALPVGNGKATITANVGAMSATVEVRVSGQEQPFQWSFRNHVASVLSKQGCNAGSCHGARAGQKGFRLTLFGFDAEADYNYLTRQAGGRRITPSDPGRSLLLTKPTGLVPHKGGVRLDPDSLEYRVLAEWIAGGTPGPRADDPLIAKVEILPKYSTHKPDSTQQLVVLATYSDGHVEDATRWAKYTATNSSVAQVEPSGKVKIVGSGESAINAWFLNVTASAFVSVPYPNELAADAFGPTQQRNFIDEHVNAKLKSLHLPPSPICDDATFLRRAYLDCTGTLPTADEARAFLSDASANKRERLVDQLLSSPAYVDYWSYKWADVLLVNGNRLRPQPVKAFYGWIREGVEKNKPWDQLAREVVTATGSTFDNGAANFYALHQDPEEMSETVAQAFLGLSINCAKCHNHPLEKWTNDQYYGMANMFARVRAKGWGGDFRGGDGLRVVYSDTQGELVQPSQGKPQPPRPLDGQAVAFDDTADRRVPLAQWLTAPQNPYFARAIANRIWANYFGLGLVERVDDLRISNPATNEELLAACANYVVERKYDLKELMRAIMLSAAYQRGSEPLPQNKVDTLYYSHYYPRRLKAEVLLDAISHATDVPTVFQEPTGQPKPNDFKELPKGTRALQLADSSIASYFLDAFGRPERKITCDCERSDEPSMPQVLHLYNGETLNKKLGSPDSRVSKSLADGKSNEAIVEELYLTALCRMPTESERSKMLSLLAATAEAERRAAIEDVYWSVLTSREFLFQH
jgi:hypothetical protein